MSVEPGLPNAASRAANRARFPTSHWTVLLVDDEDAVRSFVQTVLEQAGYAVVSAADGSIAGEIFSATPDRFDLLLTDVLMPHVTGPELAARVRKVRPQIPVVFMSAFTGGLPMVPGLVAADEQLIEKPFTVASLLNVVSAALGNNHPD
ncbi:MAG: response regulator [Planctomycetia bacterium]|nr:response regulator [Planctomycetia bacterium]